MEGVGGRPWLGMGGGHRSLPGAAEGWTKEKSPGTAGLVPIALALDQLQQMEKYTCFFRYRLYFFFFLCVKITQFK